MMFRVFLNMTLRVLILIAVVSCNTNPKTNTSSGARDSNTNISDITLANPIDTLTETQNQYSYIVRIYQMMDTTYLEADYIQYLTEESAIEAARKVNEVDTFRTKDGKIEFAVPNDYFIVNENKKIRKLPLSNDCIFDLLNNPNGIRPATNNSLNSLKEIHHDSPFILTIDKNGFVIKIKEVFLP